MICGKILNTYNYLCRLPWGSNKGGLRSLGMVPAPNLDVSSVHIKRYIIGEREREEVDGKADFVIPHRILVFFLILKR